MPAPRWFFRFMYDRESTAWARQRYAPKQRETIERFASEFTNLVDPPGPVADRAISAREHQPCGEAVPPLVTSVFWNAVIRHRRPSATSTAIMRDSCRPFSGPCGASSVDAAMAT